MYDDAEDQLAEVGDAATALIGAILHLAGHRWPESARGMRVALDDPDAAIRIAIKRMGGGVFEVTALVPDDEGPARGLIVRADTRGVPAVVQ